MSLDEVFVTECNQNVCQTKLSVYCCLSRALVEKTLSIRTRVKMFSIGN